MIPKVLHYCFGLSPGGKPWSLVHHVCLKSAIERINPKEVSFYCEYEPTGPWWELTRRLVSLKKISAPLEIWGNPLLHVAHQADVVRLEKLLEIGGIYLDIDVFVHRSFDSLLAHGAVLGEQCIGGRITGLCNAVILAEPQAPFLRRWYLEYHSFRSKGSDCYWDEHSVRLPLKLALEFPSEITVVPPRTFFWPTCESEDLRKMFASAEPLDLSASYATHLWEGSAWDSYLEQLTPKQVRSVDTNFHFWARPLLDSLPDDYGLPSVSDRLRRWGRQAKRRGFASLSRTITRPIRAVTEHF